MRHLHLIVDHDPAPSDFPPTWDEFAAARQRFFDRLATEPAPANAAVTAEPPREAVRS
jgi:hypothetical protein